MPKREDIHHILIIGSGPIIIGQACEFDYSGTQACKALREEGFRVILVNSNPATIMTAPDSADAIYIEPVVWESVAKVIERERPDALLPTMGGQTALNCALDLAREGVLDAHGVQLIGASIDAIDMAEDRERFRKAMDEIGLASAQSGLAHSMDEARQIQGDLGFPVIIRPSFTMGGSGGGIAYNIAEFEEIVKRGLDLSPTHEVLLEESLLGWKEFEMEVVRDKADNCIIICAIENLDPMGVHTGDSITVAPAQTLTDKEYQIMRDASLAVLRKIGVETGGSNVQFAVNPEDGRLVIIEMNPRVSRSSALASKATGFPIAKVAAKLAVGYTLDELANDMTGGVTPASFEPTIDYVVTKIPRFAFEKFPTADDRLTTQMKSVGEAMAIGRNFQESFQKALRSLEIDADGLDEKHDLSDLDAARPELIEAMTTPRADRIWSVGDAFRAGMSLSEVHGATSIDPWFLDQIEELISAERSLSGRTLAELDAIELRQLKRMGFADRRLAKLLGTQEEAVRSRRHQFGIRPVYKRVDTCAAEFPSATAYMYSTYDEACEAEPSNQHKVIVVGGGIAGVSIACELSRDRAVCLLEQEAALAFHTTGRSAALFLETYGNAPIRALTSASREFLTDPPEFWDSALLSPRSLLQFAVRGRGDALESLFHQVHELAPSAQLVSPTEAHALFPLLRAEHIDAALFDPEAMEVDVHALHQGYVRGLRARGGFVVTSGGVVALERLGEVWQVTSSDGSIRRAPVVVNAAGAWADSVADLAGAARVGLQPLRRTIFMLGLPEGADLARLPTLSDIDESFYLKDRKSTRLNSSH
mgnify:CR=1 FL=1